VVIDLSASISATRLSVGSRQISILSRLAFNQSKEYGDFEHTAPESTVFGTAINIGSGSFESFKAFCVYTICGMPSRHIAKGQKFSVLTVNAWRSHGGFGEVAAASTGSVFANSASSAGPSCHT